MRKVLLVATLSLTAVAGCTKSDKEPAGDQAESKLPAMTVDELDRLLAANQASAVDCNSEKTRKRSGVVPGAILITDDETFAASELPAEKTRKLVFYCANSG